MTVRTRVAATLAVAALVVPLTTAAQADRPDAASRSTAVLAWDAVAADAAVAACLSPDGNPLHESRTYAMTALAVSDALNAIDRRYRQYGPAFRAPRTASVDAAVAAAAHDVLVATISDLPLVPPECVRAGLAVVEDAWTDALAGVPAGRERDQGVAAGRRAAEGVLAVRADDGSAVPVVDPDFPQGTAPGAWRFTPDRPFAFGTHWSEVEPFALRDARQVPVAAPLPLGSARYARDLAQVRRLGGDGVGEPTARTAAQTETALFWVGSSPLLWGRIARDLAARSHLDPWEQVRLLALVHASIADGYVASFAVKYDVLFWRPVTAIQEAGTDGNPATAPGPGWQPLVTTPPIPDHASAHAVVGAAAAEAMRTYFGTDRVRFSVCSTTLPAGRCGEDGEVRHAFTRFSRAAAENGRSRVLVGFHFPHAVEAGLDQGRGVGGWVAGHLLPPA